MYSRPLTSDEIYHSLFGSNKGKEWKNHRYIKKIDGRYFYDAAEIKAYLQGKINAGKKSLYNAAGGKYKEQAKQYSKEQKKAQWEGDMHNLKIAKNNARNKAMYNRGEKLSSELHKKQADLHASQYHAKATGSQRDQTIAKAKLNVYNRDVDKHNAVIKRSNADINKNQQDSARHYDKATKAYKRAADAQLKKDVSRSNYEHSLAGKYDKMKKQHAEKKADRSFESKMYDESAKRGGKYYTPKESDVKKWASSYAKKNGLSDAWVKAYVKEWKKKKEFDSYSKTGKGPIKSYQKTTSRLL